MQRGEAGRGLAGALREPADERSQDPVRKAWETPKLQTLELASTEGGRKPSNKENGAKFVTS